MQAEGSVTAAGLFAVPRKEDTVDQQLRMVRRRLRKGRVRDEVVRAVRKGATVRETRAGLIVRGPRGVVVLHGSESDWRAQANALALMRKAAL